MPGTWAQAALAPCRALRVPPSPPWPPTGASPQLRLLVRKEIKPRFPCRRLCPAGRRWKMVSLFVAFCPGRRGPSPNGLSITNRPRLLGPQTPGLLEKRCQALPQPQAGRQVWPRPLGRLPPRGHWSRKPGSQETPALPASPGPGESPAPLSLKQGPKRHPTPLLPPDLAQPGRDPRRGGWAGQRPKGREGEGGDGKARL